MRRLIPFIFIFVFLLMAGCKKPGQGKVTAADLAADLEQITLPDEFDSVTVLPTKTARGYDVVWKWDNLTLVQGEAFSLMFGEESVLELTAKASAGEISATKSFFVGREQVTLLEDYLQIPAEATDYLQLIDKIETPSGFAPVHYSVDDRFVDVGTGKVTRRFSDYSIDLSATVSYDGREKTLDYKILIKGDGKERLEGSLFKLEVPAETQAELSLPRGVDGYLIQWESTAPELDGLTVKPGDITEEKTITLSATISQSGISATREFTLKLLPLPAEERLAYALNSLSVPSYVGTDIVLPTTLPYGYQAVWTSSDPALISSTGLITAPDQQAKPVRLSVTVETSRKDFDIFVMKDAQLLKDLSFEGTLTNLKKVGNRITLIDPASDGVYESPVFETFGFSRLVLSWVGASGLNATAEIAVRMRQDGAWSKYYSYGEWGLGRENRTTDSKDKIAKMSDDVIFINSGFADAVQFKAVLRSKNGSDLPDLAGIYATFMFKDYHPQFDVADLPRKVSYDVPLLYQRSVPEIGGIICSATSSAMLMMYHGREISEFAPDPANLTEYDRLYPHGNFARFVLDHNHDIYGNWTYNTVAMSAFGEVSYVKHLASVEELLVLLQKGPLAVSIKGKVVGESGITWNTAGHLMVVTGYEFINGELFILANDPAIKPVAERYSRDNFEAFWNNTRTVYIVE